MASNNRALSFTFTTEDQQAIASLKRIEKGFKGLDVQVDKTKKTGMNLGNAWAGLAVGAGAMFSINEFEEAEKGMRQTEAVIKSTGNAAEVSAKQQDELVTSLSKLAGVDDDVVNSGANMLRTFTDIKGEKFGEALAASLDLAAFKGQDLATTAESIGKALNNPLTGLTKLTKQGVVFTDQQKDQVKAMMEVGDVAGAQGIILAELEKEYGGQAEAAATSSGRMKVAAGEAAESVGAILAPALTVGADAAGALASGLDKLPAPVQTAVVGLAGLAYVGPKVADGVRRAKDEVGNLTGGTDKLGKAMAGIGFAGAIAGAAAYGHQLNQTTVDTEELLQATSDNLKQVTEDLLAIGEGDPGKIKDAFLKIGKEDLTGLYAMRDALGDDYEATSLLGEAIRETERAEKRGAETKDKFKGKVEEVTGATEEAADTTDEAADSTKTWFGAEKEQTESWTGRIKALNELNDEMQENVDNIWASVDASLALQGAHDGVQDAQLGLAEARKNGSAEEQQRAEDDLTEAILDEVKAADDLARKNHETAGKHYDAADSAKVQKDKLDELEKSTGHTSEQMKWLGAMLDNAAKAREVKIYTAAAEKRAATLAALLKYLNEQMAPYYEQYNASGGAGSPGGLDPRSHQKSAPATTVAPPSSGWFAPAGKSMSSDSMATGTTSSVIVQGDLVVGGKNGVRDLQMAMNQQSKRTGRQVVAGS